MLIKQFAPAGRLGIETLKAVEPAMKLILLTLKPQLIVVAPTGPKTKPAGKVSLKATFVIAVAFEFRKVKVRLVLSFTGTVAAPKAFVTMGGLPVTVRVAEAAVPVP